MRRPKITILFLVIMSMIILNTKNIHKAIADPAPIILNFYTGGLFPDENLSLSLLDAKVIINANTKNLTYFGEMSFIGNYTIFNPNNEINFTLAAPFALMEPSNCNIIINDSSVPFILMPYDDFNSTTWDEYLWIFDSLHDFGFFSRFWILCNITIPKETSVKIQYKFNTSSIPESINYGRYRLIYDVGTSRIWNGNINETVEINVHGKLPNSIYFEELCITTDFLDGKSYKWKWSNEVINIDYVGVEFRVGSSSSALIDPINTYNLLSILLLISLIALCPAYELKKFIDKRKKKL